MESMTLTPTQEQILDFVHTYRSSLTQSKNPHMDYFFRLEGATVSIYKSGKVLLQGNDLTPYLAFFGQDAGNPKGSTTSSARQDLAMIGTDEVGNGSYFGGLTVVASLSHLTSTTGSKSLVLGIRRPWMIEKFSNWLLSFEENIQHQALLLSPRSTMKSLLLATMLFRSKSLCTIRLSIFY